MTTHHGWAGSPALRVAVQLPSSTARAGVVLCPPLGQEGVIAYRTLRLLADRLEARGVASVRYDPSGRGDSADDDDPDAQVRSARAAAALLRRSGVEHVAFVGLASAALVAAAAATDEDALVVWDAPASGRAWLRRQRALAAIAIGPDRVLDRTESLVGIDLGPEELAAIGALTYPPRAATTVAVVRPGGAAPRALASAEVLEVPGTAELLDGTSIDARIPGEAVEAVARRLDRWAPAAGVPTTPPAVAEVLDVDDRVSERVLQLGPHGLFAVETVSSAQDEDAPVVLLHNGGAEHRTGAVDYQVALARTLARDGVRVMRVDRRGTGESSAVRADEDAFLFTQEWVDDQHEVVRALRIPSERLAIVGMCAGAWIAGRAVVENPRLVVEISPNDYRRTPAAPGTYAESAQAVADASRLRRALRGPYNRLVPAVVRDAVARRGALGGVVGHLGPLVEHGTDVVVVAAPEDIERFERYGGRRAVRRWGARVSVVEVPDGDHALFSLAMRRAVVDEVRSRVATTFPTRRALVR
ncbi:alpha/beta hydrolase [Curtobacterium oceanosedimentum]|uniref:Serine aminopeptidase S33 domain-containing protein n=1 Tax=Curtobacterium oceanosedimentum TaxID=465820 RepID=A0A147DT28_9MICO|nr:alpha/beta fold hydrolase [Curtobacterium oceanosedimentum]KTR53265.1 hypothetical protein NS359_03810 [Curtobacterium oceanosedimentum]